MSTQPSTLSSLLSPPAFDASSSQQPVSQPSKAVSLDFSKAQPLAQPANGSPVSLDFSKSQPINLTPEQQRSRTLSNMTLAMSGQQAQMSPDDRQQFESGRKAGTIAGGASIATGAAGGLFTPGVQVAQETSSLLGPEGQPITKEVVKEAPSLAGAAIKNILPEGATLGQAAKIAKILYHTGAGSGMAALLWHEIFGK